MKMQNLIIHTSGNGSVTIKQFFEKVIKNIERTANTYWDYTGENPLGKKEKRFNSIVASAISKISDCFIMEEGITVIEKGEKRTRYVDFWVAYRGINIWIETKHDYYAPRYGTRESLIEKWEDGLDQLSDIKYSNTKVWCTKNNMFKVLLLFSTVYNSSEKKKKLSDYNIKDISSYTELITKSIAEELTKPNFKYFQEFNKNLKKSEEFSNSHERYSGYMIHGLIKKIG